MTDTITPSKTEASTERFGFGANWQRFLSVLDDDRIAEAERSLREMLGTDDLRGRTVLDVGSGSGLFSLAAMRLGAERVTSLDYDRDSVACTAELRRRYFPEDPRWTVERGDVLDTAYLEGLGTWDIVYSWGVLHHTGDMWRALANVAPLVAPGGQLYISIYNDQGPRSQQWLSVKRTYNRLPEPLRPLFVGLVYLPIELLALAYHIVRRHPRRYLLRWTEYRSSRGMSRYHDMVDWVGGYPYEVARPEEIVEFYTSREFDLQRFTTVSSNGCNQFLFSRPPD